MQIPGKNSGNSRGYRAVFLIIILTLIVYANSFKNSFVWDDFSIIVENDFIKSWENFPRIFTPSYLTRIPDVRFSGQYDIGSGETTYRPVVTASYFLDYHFWRLNPSGYHLTSVFLHILNAILLYSLVFLITKDRRVALVSSLLFALHPVNTEAVNCISFREDLLVFLFCILSFILFIKTGQSRGKNKYWYYILSIFSFLLALFSKEMAIILPLMLIFYDRILTQARTDESRFFKWRYGGYVIAAVFALSVWFFYKKSLGGQIVEHSWPGGNFYTNILTMSKVMVTYITWMIFPVDVHSVPPSSSPILASYSFLEPGVLFSFFVIAVFVLMVFKIRRVSRKAFFAMLWFMVALLPVANLFPMSNIMACRYLYIPSAGFLFSLSVLLFRLPEAKILSISPETLRKISKDTLIVLIIFFSFFTAMRNLSWRNNFVLWSEMVQRYPGNAVAHNSLGVCYYDKNMLEEAGREFKKAIELNPDLLDAYINYGSYLGRKGLNSEAINCFTYVLELNPEYMPAYNNLGIAYARLKEWEQARKVWEKALAIKPRYKDVENNLKRLRKEGH